LGWEYAAHADEMDFLDGAVRCSRWQSPVGDITRFRKLHNIRQHDDLHDHGA